MGVDIVLAFRLSKDKKDWGLRADGDGNWFYEPSYRTYCRRHKLVGTPCWDSTHSVAMWGTHLFNLGTGRLETKPRRLYIDHYPQRGEWEHLNTIDDIKASPLYRKSRDYINKRGSFIS